MAEPLETPTITSVLQKTLLQSWLLFLKIPAIST